MAISRPWFPNSQAPELTIFQAQRVDTHALGLLSFWLLFLAPLKENEQDNVGFVEYTAYDLTVQKLEQWQSSSSLLEEVRQLVQAQERISEKDKVELRCIFELSLDLGAATIDVSSAKILHIWQNVGSYEDPDAVAFQDSEL